MLLIFKDFSTALLGRLQARTVCFSRSDLGDLATLLSLTCWPRASMGLGTRVGISVYLQEAPACTGWYWLCSCSLDWSSNADFVRLLASIHLDHVNYLWLSGFQMLIFWRFYKPCLRQTLSWGSPVPYLSNFVSRQQHHHAVAWESLSDI